MHPFTLFGTIAHLIYPIDVKLYDIFPAHINYSGFDRHKLIFAVCHITHTYVMNISTHDFDVVSMHLLMVIVGKIEIAFEIIGPQNEQTHS